MISNYSNYPAFIDLIMPVILSLANGIVVGRSQWTFGCFLNSLRLSTPISEHSGLCTRAQNNEFMSAQHSLNMAGVSKHGQKSVIKLLPAAQLQSPTLWIT